MDSDLFKISIDLYKNICGTIDYTGSHAFDKSCGLQYMDIHEHKNGKTNRKQGYEHLDYGFFYFTIEDNKLFLLAKIKYGI